MRNREKAGMIESLKYALSLKRERKLHPAIITACKTADDLDVYLACVENEVLSLFDSFKIQFDYLPAKVSRSEKI